MYSAKRLCGYYKASMVVLQCHRIIGLMLGPDQEHVRLLESAHQAMALSLVH